MSLNKGSGLRNMDATDKKLELKEAEASNSDINKEKHAESSELFSEEVPDLEYSKGEMKLKHVVDPTCNAKTMPVQLQQDQEKLIWKEIVNQPLQQKRYTEVQTQ